MRRSPPPRNQAVSVVTGTVVRLSNFGEAHRIVEVIGAECGRLSVVARHARASRRRFAGVLDHFATLRLQIQPGRTGLGSLVAADIIDARLGLRRSLPAMMRAGTLVRVARALVAEGEAAEGVVTALNDGLDALSMSTTGSLHIAAAAAALPRMAQAAGVLPRLTVCAACATSATCAGQDSDLRLDSYRIGVYCRRCAPRGSVLPAAVLAALQGQAINDEAVAQGVEAAVVAWLTQATGKLVQAATVEIAPCRVIR